MNTVWSLGVVFYAVGVPIMFTLLMVLKGPNSRAVKGVRLLDIIAASVLWPMVLVLVLAIVLALGGEDK